MKSRMLRFMPVLLLAGLALGGCQTLHGSKKAASPSVQTLDSVKENKYPWGWIRWMMNAELDPTVSQTVGIVQLEAGQCNQLHQHPNCDELIYVICGTVENTLDDQRVVLHAGDILRIDPDGLRQTGSRGQPRRTDDGHRRAGGDARVRQGADPAPALGSRPAPAAGGLAARWEMA